VAAGVAVVIGVFIFFVVEGMVIVDVIVGVERGLMHLLCSAAPGKFGLRFNVEFTKEYYECVKEEYEE